MRMTKELYDELKDLKRGKLNDKGEEVVSPKPHSLAFSRRPPTLQEQIQRVLRTELSRQADEQGYETMEEADDFDDPEFDQDPFSPYIVHDTIDEEPVSPPVNPPPEPPDPPDSDPAPPEPNE